MAYTKQTWTNDVTAITAERMTHIEQGIYDNSLATDIINPSGTATTTAEIEEGQITDVIGFKSLKLKGQTSQYTTTGKNLMNLGQTTSTQSGVACVIDRATVKLNGTTTGSLNVLSPAVKSVGTFPAGTYTISTSVLGGTVNLGSRATAYYLRNTSTTGSDNIVATGGIGNSETQKTFTLSESTELFFQMYGNGADIAFSNYIFAVQIESGSTKTSFEQYTGGKASPNPDFPQEVENVSGYNVIEISNVNKLPYAKSGSYAVSGMTHTSNGKGTYTLNGTATANSRYDWEIEPYTIKQGDYLYLGNTATNSTVTVALLENASTQIMYTGPTQVNRIVSLNNYVGRKVTYIRTYTNAQTLTNFVLKPMICTTTTVSDFVEHQGNNFEINLGKNLFDKKFRQGNASGLTDTKNIFNETNKLLKAGTYTFSTNIPSTMKFAIFGNTQKFPTSNTVTYNSTFKTGINTFTFTLSQDLYFGLMIANNDSSTIAPSDVSEYYFQLEKGAIATSYAPYFTPIELCKIGTYQDYIYKKDGKWWKHNVIKKSILNGTENWSVARNTTPYVYGLNVNDYKRTNEKICVCNYYKSTENGSVGSMSSGEIHFRYYNDNIRDLYICDNRDLSIEDFKTWLTTHNLNLYYVLATPIDEEITYAPLLRQLDELYNSGLYDVTNISQDNSSEAFILDIEACKNNINGIVEYIRR